MKIKLFRYKLKLNRYHEPTEVPKEQTVCCIPKQQGNGVLSLEIHLIFKFPYRFDYFQVHESLGQDNRSPARFFVLVRYTAVHPNQQRLQHAQPTTQNTERVFS